MQIKQFYLDLREGPQYAKNNNNVWLLESEAFKEPLKFEFTFDSEDLSMLKKIEESCKGCLNTIKEYEKRIQDKINDLNEKEKMITNSYQRLENINDKYDKLINQIKEKEDLIRKKDLSENERINQILSIIDNLKSDINKPEPSRIFDLQFEELVVGTEKFYGETYPLPPGERIIVENYEYEPQNEYVTNKDKAYFYRKYISEGYTPCVQLTSENSFDEPVAKVKLNVLFFHV